MRKILILGGTGFVGRSLCQQLVSRWPGAHLVVPTRRPAHGQAIRHLPGVELMRADVHDAAQLGALVRSCDAAVNLVAILHGRAADFARVHVALPATLARALEGAGTPRLVHVSALGASLQAPSNYLRSKAEGEASLQQAAGLALTRLRPSVIFGAHDRFLNLFASLQAWSPLLPLAGREARFQPVWVEDVAAAIVAALQDPATAGRCYECVGPEVMTLGEIVRAAGQWSGHARPQIGLPRWAGWCQALALELLPGEPLMSRDNLRSMRVPNIASGSLPGLADLGLTAHALGSVAPGYLAPGQGVARLDAWRAAHHG